MPYLTVSDTAGKLCIHVSRNIIFRRHKCTSHILTASVHQYALPEYLSTVLIYWKTLKLLESDTGNRLADCLFLYLDHQVKLHPLRQTQGIYFQPSWGKKLFSVDCACVSQLSFSASCAITTLLKCKMSHFPT